MMLNIEILRQPAPVRRPGSIRGMLVLVLSLLASQWLGVLHRIDHSGHAWSADAAQTSADKGLEEFGDPYGSDHSCIMFDAASLGDAYGLPPLLPVLLPGARISHGKTDFTSQPKRTACAFSPRAPPAA